MAMIAISNILGSFLYQVNLFKFPLKKSPCPVPFFSNLTSPTTLPIRCQAGR